MPLYNQACVLLPSALFYQGEARNKVRYMNRRLYFGAIAWDQLVTNPPDLFLPHVKDYTKREKDRLGLDSISYG
jgi:hypothetical protein